MSSSPCEVIDLTDDGGSSCDFSNPTVDNPSCPIQMGFRHLQTIIFNGKRQVKLDHKELLDLAIKACGILKFKENKLLLEEEIAFQENIKLKKYLSKITRNIRKSTILPLKSPTESARKNRLALPNNELLAYGSDISQSQINSKSEDSLTYHPPKLQPRAITFSETSQEQNINFYEKPKKQNTKYPKTSRENYNFSERSREQNKTQRVLSPAQEIQHIERKTSQTSTVKPCLAKSKPFSKLRTTQNSSYQSPEENQMEMLSEKIECLLEETHGLYEEVLSEDDGHN